MRQVTAGARPPPQAGTEGAFNHAGAEKGNVRQQAEESKGGKGELRKERGGHEWRGGCRWRPRTHARRSGNPYCTTGKGKEVERAKATQSPIRADQSPALRTKNIEGTKPGKRERRRGQREGEFQCKRRSWRRKWKRTSSPSATRIEAAT